MSPVVPPEHQVPPPDPDSPDLPEGYQPPLVHGGLFVEKNWTPRLADRLGSVRTDVLVSEHWARDIAPVMYPHLPNPFWVEAPAAPEAPPVEPGGPDEPDLPIEVTVTGVSPSGGPFKGSTGVTITGTGFIGVDPVTGVMFGTTPATGVIPGGPNQLTCLSPSAKKGTVGVSVTGTAGTGTLPNAYTFNGPTQFQVQSLSEPSGTGPTSDPSGTQQVAQTIQESAETIGQAAQDIGEAAQTLVEPSEADKDPGATPEAPSGSEGTTEAPEANLSEYELDQYWGIDEPGPEAKP